MLEKTCGWCLIWYLLFFCHGGAEVQLQWVVKEKVTAYGQDLILFCPVENCCSEPAGWSVGTKSIILDVKTFSNDPKVKYHGTYTKNGFGVVIRSLSEADLNVTYRCVYGFDQSTPKYLLHDDVFRENVPDKEKENDTTATIIVVPIVVIMVLVGIGIVAYCVYRSLIKKKIQKQTGTDQEKEYLNPSDSQMKNQPESFEVEINQKGPIVVDYGETIKINGNIILNSTTSLKVNWQKTHNNCSTTLMINCPKYSGSSCHVNNLQLVINNFDEEDAGIYKLVVISPTETKSSPEILLELFGERPSIQITPTNADVVEGQSRTIACTISSISDITDIRWIKTSATDHTIVIVIDKDGKFSGGTLSYPSLTINSMAKSDEGSYSCRATNLSGETWSEESVLTWKECFEVEIIQKGPITIGYGGTIKIDAKIKSNSTTTSLKVNWRKTHNNFSTTLKINSAKYSGSSCDVNNPQLVINNVDNEDAGIYKLEVISPTETKSSPGILLELYGGRPSIHISSTNTDIVEGQSHTIRCSIASISDITDITWNKTSATDDKIAIVVGKDEKFCGGTLSDPSLTINNIAKSDEGTYACRATDWSGATWSGDSVLTCKVVQPEDASLPEESLKGSQDLYDTALQSQPPASPTPPPSTYACSQTDDSEICKPSAFGCSSKRAALGFNTLIPPKPASTREKKATTAGYGSSIELQD